MADFDPDYPLALPAKTPLQNGGFLLEGVIGQGGSGITYLSTDTTLRRAVAIKEFFPPDSRRVGQEVQAGGTTLSSDFDLAREEFIEEARTLARFKHPGIVDVYTVFAENNSAYMVMEYLRGFDLDQMVSERGPFGETEAIRIIRQVGEALQVVHREGLLHRDVKPDNVVVRDNGTAVLIDFGLTQKQESTKGLGTVRLSSNNRLGTAGYAALEQYSRQGQVGEYTDVYALAATLYFLLTGKTPTEATERAAGVALPDPRIANAHLNPATLNALTQGMAMEVRQRPQSVRAFLELLNERQPLQTIPQAVERKAPQAKAYEAEPIKIDIPGPYSTSPGRTHDVPPAQRMPGQPHGPTRDPFTPPIRTVALSGFGCLRGLSCACGCLIIIILTIVIQLMGVVTSFLG